MTLLKLENVSKTYANGTEALQDVSLEIAAGDFVVVLGKSGSGKSTLLMSKGLNPDKLFSHSVFAGSHNAVILSIMKGEVDAGATYDDARAAIAKSFPGVYDQVRVIAHTKEIPNDTVTARKNLDPALKLKIKEGLLYLSKTPEGSRVLKRLYGISGLMDFDAFFDPVREARRLLQLGPESGKSQVKP